MINTYSVLILEDQIENINLLEIYIKKYCKFIGDVYTATNVEQAMDSYMTHNQDILLFDIELGDDATSFSFFEALPISTSSQVIFTTSYQEYAIKAINSLKVAGFLVKPIKPNDLVIALNKAVSAIDQEYKANSSVIPEYNDDEYSNFIAISTSNKIDILHPEQIVYLEADGRYTIFHLVDGEQKIASKNLGEYEKQLNPKIFFRIHHRYIVNLNKVININKAAGNYCEFLNEKPLPIARRRQEDLHKLLKIK